MNKATPRALFPDLRLVWRSGPNIQDALKTATELERVATRRWQSAVREMERHFGETPSDRPLLAWSRRLAVEIVDPQTVILERADHQERFRCVEDITAFIRHARMELGDETHPEDDELPPLLWDDTAHRPWAVWITRDATIEPIVDAGLQEVAFKLYGPSIVHRDRLDGPPGAMGLIRSVAIERAADPGPGGKPAESADYAAIPVAVTNGGRFPSPFVFPDLQSQEAFCGLTFNSIYPVRHRNGGVESPILWRAIRTVWRAMQQFDAGPVPPMPQPESVAFVHPEYGSAAFERALQVAESWLAERFGAKAARCGGAFAPPVVTTPPTIWSHGNRAYSIDRVNMVSVGEDEDSVLTAFAEAGTAMCSPELASRSGVINIRATISRLRSKYNGLFEGAIRSPGGRGKGGYLAIVRDA